jgi:dihydrofolate reductase
VDGFIAGPEGEIDWIPADDELHQHFAEEFGGADAVLFDRRAYEILVPYWDEYDIDDASGSESEAEFARVFRGTRRIVFSDSLESVDERAILIKDNVAAEVARLKSQPGGYLLLDCGPELLTTCVNAGLVDEFRPVVCPVALGRGVSLFGDLQHTLRLELLSTASLTSGAVQHRYRPVTHQPS